ncbi:MAG: lamin tail domain-containing protein, partial [Chitinophagales bacterium]
DNFITINLTTELVIGNYYDFSVSGIADLADNTMSESFVSEVVYNNNVPNLVITEIMYNNPSTDSLEFVEIYNNSDEAVQVGGIAFSKGFDFQFPTYEIQAYEYTIIAAFGGAFEAFFETPIDFNWGDSGLSNGGETIEISNTIGDIIDEVSYDDEEEWASLVAADGDGYSLVLCDPSLDNALAENWSLASDNALVDTYGDNMTNVYASPNQDNCQVTGIEENDFEQTINVLRLSNQNNDFRITATTNSPKKIEVLNVLGQTIYQASFEQAHDIFLPNLTSGVYFLQIQETNTNEKYLMKMFLN